MEDVFLLVKYGIVGLEVVLVQHVFADDGRYVEQGVAHAQEDSARDDNAHLALVV